jgi:hypothetical protein
MANRMPCPTTSKINFIASITHAKAKIEYLRAYTNIFEMPFKYTAKVIFLQSNL